MAGRVSVDLFEREETETTYVSVEPPEEIGSVADFLSAHFDQVDTGKSHLLVLGDIAVHADIAAVSSCVGEVAAVGVVRTAHAA